MKYFDHSVAQSGLVAQLVERRYPNPEVVGSNPVGLKDFSFILVLISNFFFKACGWREIMEGNIAHFLALIHTLYIIINKFTAIASLCQLSN